MKIKLYYFFLLIFLIDFSSAAHYITGFVGNALDGESSDNKIIVLWNPSVGESDNLTDIIGVNGNSGMSQVYMFDCELLNVPCEIDNVLSIKVIDNGDGYFSDIINVTVTGYGYDLATNITLKSPPKFLNITVDDNLNLTLNEIDLITNSVQKVTCEAIIHEYDGENITNVFSVFYSPTYSSFFGSNDNNYHYSNSSCLINRTYAENETKVICSFDVFYYAVSSTWNCEINASDSFVWGKGVDETFVNPLLSIGVDEVVNFTGAKLFDVSDEVNISITNFGNVRVNLSLYGYAKTPGDNYSMNCSSISIPVGYKKYNLSNSNFGDMNLTEFENKYVNLSGSPKIEKFNLNSRQNDSVNEAVKQTYWRIYLPEVVLGECQGNIVFGAVSS